MVMDMLSHILIQVCFSYDSESGNEDYLCNNEVTRKPKPMV